MNMYHHGCKCPHHWLARIMAALVWVAGVLFFWSSWRMTAVWGFESLYYAWVVVVLSLMSFGMKNCGCCGMGKMGMMGEGKECKACMGMGGEHTHEHRDHKGM